MVRHYVKISLGMELGMIGEGGAGRCDHEAGGARHRSPG